MLDYVRQVAIGNAVRETIKQALSQSNDIGVRAKIIDIPTTESVLRAVSLHPSLNTEDKLKDFITDHFLASLRLTEIQKEQLGLHAENRKVLEDFLSTGSKTDLG